MYAFSTMLNSLVSTIINISYLSLFYTIEEAVNSFLKYPLKNYWFTCFLHYSLANVTHISPLLSPENFKYLASLLSVIDKSSSFLSCFAVSWQMLTTSLIAKLDLYSYHVLFAR